MGFLSIALSCWTFSLCFLIHWAWSGSIHSHCSRKNSMYQRALSHHTHHMHTPIIIWLASKTYPWAFPICVWTCGYSELGNNSSTLIYFFNYFLKTTTGSNSPASSARSHYSVHSQQLHSCHFFANGFYSAREEVLTIGKRSLTVRRPNLSLNCVVY